jgi:uncharacterized protein YjbI with pentapeptide repeats
MVYITTAIRNRFESMKKEEEDKTSGLGDLKTILDESSKHNRNILVFFILFFIYIVITVATTTDRQLLLPGSTVHLPLLNVEIPLFGIYIVTPFLAVALHFNVLFNLFEHSRKLHEWHRRVDDDDTLFHFPFMFNYIFSDKGGRFNLIILKTIIWGIYGFLPLLSLLFIQLRFSEYHSLPMTVWHAAIFFFDVTILLMYWHKSMAPELFDKEREILTDIVAFHFERGFLGLISTWTLVCVAALNLIVMVLLATSNISKSYFNDRKFLIPHLELAEEVLVASPPSDTIIQRYLAMSGKSEEDAWMDFAHGSKLKGRDLSFANFNKSNLMQANMEDANLQGANLKKAYLKGANLLRANLKETYLTSAKLHGANLEDAKLQGASLRNTELQGAYLLNAKLNGADLTYANLQGAEMAYATLQGAELSYASMQGVNLKDARLQGANLKDAKLQGANLKYVYVQGSFLKGVSLQGANLWDAVLQGNWGDASIDKSADWSTIIKDNLSLIPENMNTTFKRNIDAAKTRTENAAKNGTEIIDATELMRRLKSNNSFASFMKVRNVLSCMDEYTGKGVALQYLDNSITTDTSLSGRELLEQMQKHMKQNCPKMVNEIEWVILKKSIIGNPPPQEHTLKED